MPRSRRKSDPSSKYFLSVDECSISPLGNGVVGTYAHMCNRQPGQKERYLHSNYLPTFESALENIFSDSLNSTITLDDLTDLVFSSRQNYCDTVTKNTGYVQNIWNSSMFWQLSKRLENEIAWEHNFKRRVELRETSRALYELPFWLLQKQTYWHFSPVESHANACTDKNADSMHKFQNLRLPPPSSKSIHAQHASVHVYTDLSSVFGRETEVPHDCILPNDGGVKHCRNKSKRLSKRSYLIYPALRLNLLNHLKRLFMSSFKCLKIILNLLNKAFLSLSKYYTVLMMAILLMHSKTWRCYLCSSDANYRRTNDTHKKLSNQRKLF